VEGNSEITRETAEENDRMLEATNKSLHLQSCAVKPASTAVHNTTKKGADAVWKWFKDLFPYKNTQYLRPNIFQTSQTIFCQATFWVLYPFGWWWLPALVFMCHRCNPALRQLIPSDTTSPIASKNTPIYLSCTSSPSFRSSSCRCSYDPSTSPARRVTICTFL